MRLDSHQHFWLYNERDYVWMTSEMDVLRRDFTPDDLLPLLKAIDFEGSIAVQARQMLAETDWLLQLAEQHPFIHGVVGWVDFESNQLDEVLERYASHPKLKGVRELIHDMDDAEYATSTTHLRAIAQLARYGLTYDLLLKPPHIRPAIELIRSFPNQLFVVDHIAKPDIANRIEHAMVGRDAKIGQFRQCLLQAFGHGNGSCLGRLEAKRLSTLFGHDARGVWSRAADGRFRLAGVHALGQLRRRDANCDRLCRRLIGART